MKPNPLQQLNMLGQSFWLDYIRRDLITGGGLKRLIAEDGLRGMTSNPAIFEKAITESHDYDADIRTMALAGLDEKAIYEMLSRSDVQSAADEFRPLYDRTGGLDGYVSLEVNPHLAHDTRGTVREARRLWGALNRPNVLIKVPATREGLPAIAELISEGINVNVTLLFGLPRYRQVAEAYLAGMEARLAQVDSVAHVASVASFFLSRIDTLVDPLLDERIARGGEKGELARQVRGQVASASAKMAYQIYKEIFGGRPLRRAGGPGRHRPASSLGQYRHQEPGLQRREVHRGDHRARHGQHHPGRDPRTRTATTGFPRPVSSRMSKRPPAYWNACRSWTSASMRSRSSSRTKGWKNSSSRSTSCCRPWRNGRPGIGRKGPEGRMAGKKVKSLSPELLIRMDAYWRAANYLSVGQLYLCDNPSAARAAQAGSRQIDAARALGDHAGAEFHLRAFEPGHQEV